MSSSRERKKEKKTSTVVRRFSIVSCRVVSCRVVS